MAELCADPQWEDEPAVKALMLEHHMAPRAGFLDMFEALDRDLASAPDFERENSPDCASLRSGSRLWLAQHAPGTTLC
jgi:hypothetical protein